MNREHTHVSTALASGVLEQKFKAYHVQDENRSAAEKAVRRIFRKTYNADIKEFLPLLLTIENSSSIAAVIGLRNAGHCPLFVENYLTSPIEQLINNIAQKNKVNRADIVEIGNLVSDINGASYFLFVVLAFALQQAQIKWVAFTMTSVVEKLLNRLHMEPIVICQAQQSAVANSASSWGSYYHNAPKVSVGSVDDACALLIKDRRINQLRTHFQDDISSLARSIEIGCINE